MTTIGKRGPSSFIFEAKYEEVFRSEDVKFFRDELNLTTKEFSVAFVISEKTLISLEKGESKGRDIMRRLELYIRFPRVALFEFRRNAARIHRDKQRFVEQVLSRKIKESEIKT